MELPKGLLDQFNKRYLIFKGTEYEATTVNQYRKALKAIDKRVKAGEKGRIVESYRAV